MYLLSLAEPIKTLDWLAFNIPINGWRGKERFKGVIWNEGILWAWAFYILAIVIESMVIGLVVSFLIHNQGEPRGFDFLLVSDVNYITALKWSYLVNGLRALSFPFILVFSNGVMAIYLKIFCGLVDQRKLKANQTKEILAISNASYIYYCVPFWGKLTQKLMEFIQLYRALKWRMGWSGVKTFFVLELFYILGLCVILLPFVAFFLFLVLNFSY